MRVREFADWSPVAPRGAPSRIATPTRALWLHHGGTGRAATVATAVAHTRYHIGTLGWLHAGYQGYVVPGELLLARPADRNGAHTRGHNDESALCVPGHVTSSDVTDALLDTLAEAAAHGHRRGWWPAQFAGGHRDAPRNTSGTVCPGDPLHAAIPEVNRRARRLLAPTPDPTEEAPAMLTRIDGSQTVYQIVGGDLHALSREQADNIGKVMGWDRWQDHVGDITRDEVRAAGYRIVQAA